MMGKFKYDIQPDGKFLRTQEVVGVVVSPEEVEQELTNRIVDAERQVASAKAALVALRAERDEIRQAAKGV